MSSSAVGSIKLFDAKLSQSDKYNISEQELATLMREERINKNRIIFLIHEALSKEKIKPNTVLVIAPQVWHDEDCLVPFAMALKAGANPNLYVTRFNASQCHILAFLGESFIQKDTLAVASSDTLKELFILLLLSGADLEATYFPPRNDYGQQELVIQRLIQKAVLPDFITSPQQVKQELQDSKYDKYRLMLGQKVNIGKDDHLRVALLCVKFFSPNIFDQINLTENESYRVLEEAVYRFNKVAFDKLLARGYLPNYSLTNELLIYLKRSGEQRDSYSVKMLQEMLANAVDHGLELDANQFQYAHSNDEKDYLYNLLKEHYNAPYVTKACKSSEGKSPRRLKVLAAGLNLDITDDKKQLCTDLSNVRKTTKNDYVTGSRQRQQKLYSAEIGIPSDYVTPENKIDTATQDIRDFSNVPDAFDYNDISLSVYRDDTKRVWFFNSGEYYDLLYENGQPKDKPTNPVTGKELPIKFIGQIKTKLEQLKDLGLEDPYGPGQLKSIGLRSKVPDAYDQLNSVEKYEVTHENDLETFFDYAKAQDIPKNSLMKVSAQQFQDTINSVVSNRVELLPIANQRSYLFTTVAILVNSLADEDRKRFFEILRDKIVTDGLNSRISPPDPQEKSPSFNLVVTGDGPVEETLTTPA